MNKKLLLSSVTASLILIGCGGGGGENEINNASNVIQKAYYIDSPVENLDYKCINTQNVTLTEGVTGKDGEFLFKPNTQCDFFIGGKKLDSLTPTEDGQKLFVYRGDVAKVLLSLDKDNNASNGISISDSVKKEIKSFAKEDFSNILTDLKDRGLIKKVYSYNEALNHLQNITKEAFKILQGKTLYYINVDTQSDTPVYSIENMKFNNDLTKVSFEEEGNDVTYKLKLAEGGQLKVIKLDDSLDIAVYSLYFIKSTNKKIVLNKQGLHFNKTLELYFNKADAQNVLSSNSSTDNFKPIPITLSMLDGYKITYKNGSAYIKIERDSATLEDGREKGGGIATIVNGNTLVVWPGESYEYRVQFGSLPKVGTTIKVVKEGGKDSYFSTITDITKQN